MGSQRALGLRTFKSPADLDATLVAIVDRLARRLRAARRVCRTVMLRLRFDDFSRASRSRTLPRATAARRTILNAATGLLGTAMPMIARRGLTLVGVTVGNLESEGAGIQLELPIDRGGSGALDAAIDELRDRFGADAVTRAALLRRGPNLSASLLAGDERAKRHG